MALQTREELVNQIKETKRELWQKIQEYATYLNDKDEFQLMHELITESPLYQGANTSLMFYQDRMMVVDALLVGAKAAQIVIEEPTREIEDDEFLETEQIETVVDVAKEISGVEEVPQIAGSEPIEVNTDEETEQQPVNFKTEVIDVTTPVIEKINELEQEAIFQEEEIGHEEELTQEEKQNINDDDEYAYLYDDLDRQAKERDDAETKAIEQEDLVEEDEDVPTWDDALGTKLTFDIGFSENRVVNDLPQGLSFAFVNQVLGVIDEVIDDDENYGGYDKTDFNLRLDFMDGSEPFEYSGRYDLGDGDGSIINHIENFHQFIAEQNIGDNAEQSEMIVRDIVPRLREHETLTDEEKHALDYFAQVYKNVKEANKYGEDRAEIEDAALNFLVNFANNPNLRQEQTVDVDEITQEKPVEIEKPEVKVEASVKLDAQAGGGEKTHASKNIEALKVLQKRREGQELTQDDVNTLAGFSGWGSCADVFSDKEDWQALHGELSNLQDDNEQMQAMMTTLTSFYTPEDLGQAIWEHLNAAGFEGGRVLEPAIGMGNLIRVMDDDLRQASKIDGVEIDSQVAEMSQVIMQDVNVINADFGKCEFEKGSYDAVVSNVPFGEVKIDGEGGHGSMMIHDYYFVRAMDALKEGGVCAFVTSTGTLDKVNSNIRQVIAEDNQFCGAIRLPNGYFKDQANTNVATDVIFLRKGFKKGVDKQANRDLWCKTEKFEDSEQVLNTWFANNPELVLGDIQVGTNQYGETLKFVNENGVSRSDIDKAMVQLSGQFGVFYDLHLSEIKPNLHKAERDATQLIGLSAEEYKKLSKTQKPKYDGAVKVLTTAKELLDLESNNDDEEKIKEKREELNEAYDTFVLKNGYMSLNKNKKTLDLTKQAPFLLSLENSVKGDKTQFTKADIFEHRVISQKQEISVNNFSDALTVSLLNKGKIDTDYMLSFFEGKSEDDLYNELKGTIFWDINNDEFVTKDEFCSGNVRKKLEAYQTKNVELTEPAPVEMEDVFRDLMTKYDWAEISPMTEDEETLLSVFKNEYYEMSDSMRAKLDSYDMVHLFNQTLLQNEDFAGAYKNIITDGGIVTYQFVNEMYELTYKDRPAIPMDFIYNAYNEETNMIEAATEDVADVRMPATRIFTPFDRQPGTRYSTPRNDIKAKLDWAINNLRDEKDFYSYSPEQVVSSRVIVKDRYSNDIEYWSGLSNHNKDGLDVVAGFKAYLFRNESKEFLQGIIDKLNALPTETPDDLRYKDSDDGEVKRLLEAVTKQAQECVELLKPKYAEFEVWCKEELERRNEKPEVTALNGYVRDGLEMIESVQPEDLTKDEISVSLSSCWVDHQVFERFASRELDLSAKIEYVEAESKWNVAKGSNYNWNNGNGQYSTNDKNTLELLRASMNDRAIRIKRKTTDGAGNEVEVVDENATMAAQEKQLAIEDRFKSWIWEDEQVADYLVKTYNERFNCYRTREYDGSNLVFQGMSDKYDLYSHQKNAVARTLYSQTGSLFAHVVGAGKTLEFITSVMERKRLGLCDKPLIVVPKHIINQTASEFFKAYPNANLLVAGDKDFAKDKRKEFISRIATGNWDAVILSHEQLQKISFSRDYEVQATQKRLNEFMDGYEAAFARTHEKNSPSVKAFAKQVKKYQEKLDKLLNAEDKDLDGIPFENLGADMLVVDEAHAFKNLAYPTSHTTVAGVNSSASQRSEDMLMKTDFLRSKYGSNSILFATGTPISNSMSELYTMTRYLSPELLDELGLKAFDKWASVFASIETKWEILPEGGGLQQKQRLGAFKNLPELMNMVGSFADIKSQEDLDEVIVPDFEEITVAVEPTEQQKQLIDYVYIRAKRLRDKEVIDPREDNFLNITNDARRLSLDARLLFVGEDGFDVTDEEQFPRPEGGKINACADNVFSEYEKSNDLHGTQLVFCDASTPASGKWNVYDELKRCLIERGIDESEIAFVHDAKNDNERAKLFDKVQNGEIRVLLGSTSKLGTGTNVQNLLVASHDLDCPWKPSDLEQRKGRVVRNGNTNDNVKVYRYVTEGTFDSYLYSLVSNKQHFISQILNRRGNERVVDDLGTELELSFSEIASVAMGDDRLRERMELETDIRRLKISKSNFVRQQINIENQVNHILPRDIEKLDKQRDALRANNELLQSQPKGVKWCGIEIDGVIYGEDEKTKACHDLYKKAVQGQYMFSQGSVLGHYKGFDIVLSKENFTNINAPIVSLRNPENTYQMVCKSFLKPNSSANVQLLDNVLGRIEDEINNATCAIDAKQKQLNNLSEHVGEAWDKTEELKQKEERFAVLDAELKTAEDEFANRQVEDISLDSIIEAKNVAVVDSVGNLKSAIDDGVVSNQPTSKDGLKTQSVDEFGKPKITKADILPPNESIAQAKVEAEAYNKGLGISSKNPQL